MIHYCCYFISPQICKSMADQEKPKYEDENGYYVRPDDEQLKKNDEYWTKKMHIDYEKYIEQFKKFDNIFITYQGRQFSIFMKHAEVHRYFVIALVEESKKATIARFGVDLYLHVSSVEMDKKSQIAIVSRGSYLNVNKSVNVPELIKALIEVGVISKPKQIIENPDDDQFSQFWICDVLQFPGARL